MESKCSVYFDTSDNEGCTHSQRTICRVCMYEYIRSNWNLGIDISCPECSTILSHDAIKSILYSSGDIKLYQRYVQFDLYRALENNPEFIWCAHGCGSGQLNEGATMNTTVQCIQCSKLTCFRHRSPWHEGLTCEEYDLPKNTREQHASERWIDGHTKTCPKCHVHIEKNEGCDHMTCRKCQYEFCWECLVPYSNIRRHGAYLHGKKCKHYPPTETRTLFKRFIDLF